MQTESLGFFGSVQQKIDSFFSSLNITARDMISYVTCFGIGFGAGLLFRRYGKWMVSIFLAVIIVLAVLHYFELITVHQATIKCMLGMYDVYTISDFCTFITEKFTLYWLQCLIFVVSFLFGFKLG